MGPSSQPRHTRHVLVVMQKLGQSAVPAGCRAEGGDTKRERCVNLPITYICGVCLMHEGCDFVIHAWTYVHVQCKS